MNIGIIGPQCAGKSTLAEYLGGVVVKFAAPLYAVNKTLGIPKNRGFMQELSDLVKKYQGRDYFLKSFANFTQPSNGDHLLICDDIRYELEAEYLINQGWRLIYIDATEQIRRDRARKLGLDFKPHHDSEIEIESLSDWCCICVNNNHNDIDRLKKRALEIKQKLGA